MRIALIALLLALLLPSSATSRTLLLPEPTASASEAAEGISTTRVRDSLAIAERIFGRALLCGPARVIVLSEAEMSTIADDGRAVGHARKDYCDIALNASLFDLGDADERMDTCAVIVHEYGHILGYEHDYTPGSMSIMRPSPLSGPSRVVYECYRRFIPRKQRGRWRAAHGRAEWLLPPTPFSP